MFERSGTEVAKRRMTSPAIIEELEIVEEVGASLAAGSPRRVVDELDLQRGEEAFGNGVVPAIAPAAHAADDAMGRQGSLIVPAGILTPPIRMMEQPLRRASPRQRHPQGITGQGIGDALAHGPADSK